MNGREFLDQARVDRRILDYQVDERDAPTQAEMHSEMSTASYGLLTNLYQLGEVDFLTDPTPTHAAAVADEFLDDIVVPDFSKIIGNLTPRYTGRVQAVKDNDNTRELSAEELTGKIDAELGGARNRLEMLSLIMLAQTVQSINKNGPKIDAGKRTVAAEANESFGRNQSKIVRELEGNAFTIALTRDEQGNNTNTEAIKRARNTRLPKWIEASKEWDESMKTMVGKGMLEFDAFFTILEWCKKRRNGCVPIMAPVALENAPIPEGAINTNSDILICDLTANRIHPVQVKNHVTSAVVESYMKGMRFVTPMTLGAIQTAPVIVDMPKGRKTEAWSTTSYGALFSASINGFKGLKITPEQHAQQAKAFGNLDRLFAA